MGDAVSFRRALDKARQKHRPSRLWSLTVPLTVTGSVALSTVLGHGKLDQLFAMIFSLSVAVWAISDSHVFGLAVDVMAGLDAIEETVDALQNEISSLKREVADLRAKAGDY
jgi:hypothetical protein